jgi:hypothetical protein
MKHRLFWYNSNLDCLDYETGETGVEPGPGDWISDASKEGSVIISSYQDKWRSVAFLVTIPHQQRGCVIWSKNKKAPFVRKNFVMFDEDCALWAEKLGEENRHFTLGIPCESKENEIYLAIIKQLAAWKDVFYLDDLAKLTTNKRLKVETF